MRISSRRSIRRGFTLLEVLLASAIAVLLMGALYVAMQVELQQASEGREMIERATLARAIINRVSIDLSPSITPPKATSKAQAASSAAASSTASSSTTSQAATQATTAIPFQAGLVGTNTQLIIFTTRVTSTTDVLNSLNGTQAPDTPVPSDLRRVAYWIAQNGGLCRQEIPWVTSDLTYQSTDPVMEDGKTEDDYIIAREVTDLIFEYYDINNATVDDAGWTDTWDGTVLSPDGMTPQGPPTAIRITFTIQTTAPDGKKTDKAYKHVIPIITASGPNPMSADSTTQPMQ